MSRFEVIKVGEPSESWTWWHLTPGTLLRRNHATYRIVGSCRGRGRLLLRRLGQ